MSKLNHSGDVSLQRQINRFCEEIQQVNLEPDNFFDQLQGVLEQLLCNRIVIHPKKNRTRKFPQLERRDNILWIYYFHPPKESPAIPTDIIMLQISIAIVLSACPVQFVDDLPEDETVCSFSERCPVQANLSTQMYNVIRSKIM